MKKTLAMALLPLLAAGCGSPKDENNDGIADGVQTPGSVSVVAPSTPMGTVSGQVLNSKFQPLEGVEVAVTVGSAPSGLKGTSDAAGNFAIKDVPAGASVLLTFNKAGYATYRSTATVPSTAGNVPINNGNANFGPVVMGDTSGSVKFYVYTPAGRPATGASATLTVNPASYLLSRTSENITTQTLAVQGTVDSNGVLTFNGVPSAEEGARISSTYTVYISPMDTNSDGIPDVDGSVTPFQAATLLTGGNSGVYEATTIQLPATAPASGLAVKYSSLASIQTGDLRPLQNMVRPGDSIYVTFNQPIQPGSLLVTFTDEYGKESLPVTKNLGGANSFLSISPGQTSVGKEYNLYIRAVAASDGSRFERSVPFFVGDSSSIPAIAVDTIRYQESGSNNNRIDAGERVYINFNQVMTYLTNNTYNGQLQVYVDYDLNGSNVIGDATGEKGGYPKYSGFPVIMWEPTAPIQTRIPAETSVFSLATSGYTTRFYFTLSGYRTDGVTPIFMDTGSISSASTLTLKYSAVAPVTEAHYQNAWGIPQMTDLVVPFAPSAIPVPVAVP